MFYLSLGLFSLTVLESEFVALSRVWIADYDRCVSFIPSLGMPRQPLAQVLQISAHLGVPVPIAVPINRISYVHRT